MDPADDPRMGHANDPMTGPSQARIDANRRNARRSTGPRTPEGKAASSKNALKHGLCAVAPVLPGEDPAALQARHDRWLTLFDADSPDQALLVARAANASWRLDRCAVAEAAHLAEAVRYAALNYDHDRRAHALALGALLIERPGSLTRGPQIYDRILGPWIVARLRNDPALIALELKKSLAGVEWLLEQWGEWVDRLGSISRVHANDRVKAVRMLGRRPEDLMDDMVVQEFLLGCHGLYDEYDLRSEATQFTHCAHDFELDANRVATTLAPHVPATREAALELIMKVIGPELQALHALRAALLPLDAASRAEAPDRASFDPSYCNLMRRYESSLERDLHRTLTLLSRLRKDAAKAPRRNEPNAQPLDTEGLASPHPRTLPADPVPPPASPRKSAHPPLHHPEATPRPLE